LIRVISFPLLKEGYELRILGRARGLYIMCLV
jgi:hypothetical protein